MTIQEEDDRTVKIGIFIVIFIVLFGAFTLLSDYRQVCEESFVYNIRNNTSLTCDDYLYIKEHTIFIGNTNVK